MKNFLMTAFSVMVIVVGLSACGKKDDAVPVTTTSNQCSATPNTPILYNGSCYPQANCPAGVAYVNGQCLTGTTSTATTPVTPVTAGGCPTNTFPTDAGCLPQGGCRAGYAMKSDVTPNQCFPISGQTGYNQYGNGYTGYNNNGYYNYGSNSYSNGYNGGYYNGYFYIHF